MAVHGEGTNPRRLSQITPYKPLYTYCQGDGDALPQQAIKEDENNSPSEGPHRRRPDNPYFCNRASDSRIEASDRVAVSHLSSYSCWCVLAETRDLRLRSKYKT